MAKKAKKSKGKVKPAGYFWSAYYSIAQGLSAAADMFWSIYDRTKNPYIAGAASLGACASDTYDSYTFQGEEIRDDFRDKNEGSELKDSNHISSKEHQQAVEDTRKGKYEKSDNNNHHEDQEEIIETETSSPLKDWCRWMLSIPTQTSYTLLDGAKITANRFFMLSILFALCRANPTQPLFWIILASDVVLKMVFNGTNEFYGSVKSIARGVSGDEEAKPFYRYLCYPISGPRSRTFFSALGSAEHMLADDVAPWAALLPREARDYLLANPTVGIAVGGIAALVGIPLALLIYVQTYKFEGKESDKHLEKIKRELQTINGEEKGLLHKDNNTKSCFSARFRKKVIEILSRGLNSMPIVHGVATAWSLQVAIRELFTDPWIKWLFSTGVALFAFAGTAKGIKHSELRKAQEGLEKDLLETVKEMSVNNHVPDHVPVPAR